MASVCSAARACAPRLPLPRARMFLQLLSVLCWSATTSSVALQVGLLAIALGGLQSTALAGAQSESGVGAAGTSGGRPPIGWGFHSHQGLPPLPPSMRSRYGLNQSLVGYFVANSSGLANPAELAAETKLAIVGVGWNLAHLETSVGGGLERYEIEQAAALKLAKPGVGVMVLRNTEVVSTFWTAFRQAMNASDLWLQSPPGSGKPISTPWGTDDPNSGGPTPSFFLNYSNPATQRWWVEQYVAPALDQPNIDGVYMDISGAPPYPGYQTTLAELAGRQAAFDAALALARSKGKWFSAWTGKAVTSAPTGASDCVAVMNRLIALGADEHHTMQLEGWQSRPPRWPPLYTVAKNTIAAFLIARGPSALVVLPPYDRPMLGGLYTIEGVDADADPGTPLGPGRSCGASNSTFTRSYTHANVTLDCTTFTSTMTFA